MKSKIELLKEQEVHQVHIGGIVYEMVKIYQAEKAMEKYAIQIRDCEHEAINGGEYWVCKNCGKKLSE